MNDVHTREMRSYQMDKNEDKMVMRKNQAINGLNNFVYFIYV